MQMPLHLNTAMHPTREVQRALLHPNGTRCFLSRGRSLYSGDELGIRVRDEEHYFVHFSAQKFALSESKVQLEITSFGSKCVGSWEIVSIHFKCIFLRDEFLVNYSSCNEIILLKLCRVVLHK